MGLGRRNEVPKINDGYGTIGLDFTINLPWAYHIFVLRTDTASVLQHESTLY